MSAAMLRAARRRPLFTPDDDANVVDLREPALHRMLPHRTPFLLVDCIDRVSLDAARIRGRRSIDPGDPVFAGHFPGDPVYPGVLLLEMVGQVGICLQHLLTARRTAVADDDVPKRLRLLKIREAIFVGAVRPGDEVELLVHATDPGDYVSTCVGQVVRDGEVLAAAAWEAVFID